LLGLLRAIPLVKSSVVCPGSRNTGSGHGGIFKKADGLSKSVGGFFEEDIEGYKSLRHPYEH
jgi:hypothetical protein